MYTYINLYLFRYYSLKSLFLLQHIPLNQFKFVSVQMRFLFISFIS